MELWGAHGGAHGMALQVVELMRTGCAWGVRMEKFSPMRTPPKTL